MQTLQLTKAVRRAVTACVLTLSGLAHAAPTPCIQLAGPQVPELARELAAHELVLGTQDKLLPRSTARSGQALLSAYERVTQAAQLRPVLLVCDSQQANAFASLLRPDLPMVVVETQLLSLLDDESEIAAVLGHEFAHLMLGHIVQRGLAVQVVGRTSGSLDDKLKALSRFSRNQERDADEKGFSLAVTLAGYPAAGLGSAADKMLRLTGRAHATYLDSHPGLLERKDKAAQLSSNQRYIDEARQLSRAGRMRELGALTQTWLQGFPDSGAAWYYRGIYLVRQSKAGGGATSAFEKAVNNYLGSTDLGTLSQEDEAEVDYAWLQLCSALHAEGYREEAMSCHGRIRDPALREDFARRTFGSYVLVAGERSLRSDMWLARSESGSKLITNDESIAASRKQYTKLPPAWNAMRFPATPASTPQAK